MRGLHTRRVRRSAGWAGLLLIALFGSQQAAAQRPVQLFDPFYQGETARRSFFDRYAVTAEVFVRPAGLLQSKSQAVIARPLAVNARVEYQLADHFDLGLFIDAAGSGVGRSLSLNWLSLKYYRVDDVVDYAIRFAVDPVSDGRSGFPQMDLAFLYGSPVNTTLSIDYALGMRRVQLGLQEIMSTDGAASGVDRVLLRTHALGWEVHMSVRYSLLFDPAGSHAFLLLLGEAGRYDLVEWEVDGSAGPVSPPPDRTSTRYGGGVVWARTGFQIDRPSYRFAPFLALPLKQWAPESGDWPSARPRIGLQFTLR